MSTSECKGVFFRIPYHPLTSTTYQVYDVSDRRDLAALCLVCKLANRAATPFLYRSVLFNLAFHGNPSTEGLIDVLTKRRPGHRDFVRGVTVVRDFLGNELEKSLTLGWSYNAERLTELLPLLSNIHQFRYVPLPNYLSEYHLNLRYRWVVPGITRSDMHRALRRYQSLTKIAISDASFLPNWKTDAQHYRSSISGGRMTSIPDRKISPFRFKSLGLSFGDSKCLQMVANRPGCDDIIGTDSSVATFEELTQEACDFLSAGTFVQQQINLSEVLAWELTNCANLGFLFDEFLCASNNQKLKRLIVRNTSDRNIFGYFDREKFERWLMLYKGLEDVAFINLGDNRPSFEAISAHGATLKRLAIQEYEIPQSEKRPYPSAENVQLLLDNCPNLQHLSLDLPATAISDEDEIVTILREFEQITHLVIRNPLDIYTPVHDPEVLKSTILDRSWVLQIFDSIASPHLMRLNLYSVELPSGHGTLQKNKADDLQHHWRVDRVGATLRVRDLTPKILKAKRHRSNSDGQEAHV